MKHLLIFLILLWGQGVYAHDHSTGIHGMVLMQVDERIVASHMPLHNSKHAFQILLELNVADKKRIIIKNLLAKHSLVTLMPERFSLSELQNGQLTQFNGTVFTNHFERNGIVAIKNMGFNVKRVLLNQPLLSIDNGEYYVVHLTTNNALLVHRIGKPPSFDQILLVSDSDANSHSQVKQVSLATTIPLDITSAKQALNRVGVANGVFGFEAMLYLETLDFLQ